MEARFIGDPTDRNSGPARLTTWGVDFVYNEWTPVPDGLAEKFERHSHFETRAGDGAAAPEPEPEVDGDVADLRAQLDALGVEYHPRAGVKKLTELLEAATAPPAEQA